MIKHPLSTLLLLLLLGFATHGAAQDAELGATAYFSFHSNAKLNAHLSLYEKSLSCLFAKKPNDSLALFACKNKLSALSPKELQAMNALLLFYRDSVVKKDLLFDSLQRDLSDRLCATKNSAPKNKWQQQVMAQVDEFMPLFKRLYWPAIDSASQAWLRANKEQVARMESSLVPRLEKIYQAPLSKGLIRVDLAGYATWAGAYSYNDTYKHVVVSSLHPSNQNERAAEVMFHETSHFLVDKLVELIRKEAGTRDLRKSQNLWHNMIFYTTGVVMDSWYKNEAKLYTPFYEQMNFETKFPDFKTSMDACRRYWNPYINGRSSFGDAAKEIVNYVLEKK
jgi:hypothetical protein